MDQYLGTLQDELRKALDVAGRARSVGIDPRTSVEIPVASDLRGSRSTRATSRRPPSWARRPATTGISAANKAQAIYANYLEEDEKRKLELFDEVARRAEKLQAKQPKNANAFYWQAYALGRYAQGISVAKALAQGIGGKVKAALEAAIKLAPKHADAHIALGSYHAEVIDKVGAMIGGLTYGAKKDTALKLYETALKLAPDSAIARIEYANGLVLLEGKKSLARAEKLYAEAAACEPISRPTC